MHVEEDEIQAFGPVIMGTVLDYDHDDFVRELAGGSPMAVAVRPPSSLRTPVNNIEYFPPNFEGLVLGCIDADFCK